MATITARATTVWKRDNFGRFAAECEKAATRTVQQTIKRGERTSRAMAPAGKARWRYAGRPGYIPLKRSIGSRMLTATSGEWYSTAPHALHVEFGTGARTQPAKAVFTWHNGWFYWNNPAFGPKGSGKPYENWTPGAGAWIKHPGINAQPFLEPAYRRVVLGGEMMRIAKKEFPG